MGNQRIEQSSPVRGRGGRGETRARAFGGVGRQRALRHQQQCPAHVSNAAIHFTGGIDEDAVTEYSFRQARGCRFVVAALNANKDHEAVADRGNAFTRYLHGCNAYTLQ